MSFNVLGAIGGAVGGFFTGGPVGAAVGGVEGGLSGSAPAGPAPGANPLLPMIPPPPDTITSLLGQGQPVEDMSSTLASPDRGDTSADAADAMASIADFS